MSTVVLLGTLDTKGEEYEFLRERLRELDVETVLVDVGVFEPSGATPDVGREEVARAAGESVERLAEERDRGRAVEAMSRGASEVVLGLRAEGRLDGILALGGSGGSALASRAMQALPVGVPKLLVSTVASGDTRPYVGATDVTMTYSVVDIAGINHVSARILANAAGAISGMVKARPPDLGEARPLVGASMFGVTTPAVDVARRELDAAGYEVLVFHQTGTGGESLEALARDGYLAATLDITLTEFADRLVGGVFPAGERRLETAGELGLAQVVSLGALDMVNFGPLASVPERFGSRNLYVHNPTVTLMRTTPEECAELGRLVARKLNASRGPVTLFVPLGGVSAISTEGQPFYDPEADRALFEAIRAEVSADVEVVESESDINDPAFAKAMARRLEDYLRDGEGERA